MVFLKEMWGNNDGVLFLKCLFFLNNNEIRRECVMVNNKFIFCLMGEGNYVSSESGYD